MYKKRYFRIFFFDPFFLNRLKSTVCYCCLLLEYSNLSAKIRQILKNLLFIDIYKNFRVKIFQTATNLQDFRGLNKECLLIF